VARGDAGEMRSLLRQRLADALAPAGWLPATPARESTHMLAEFVRPVHGEIAATASVIRASSIPDRLPVRIAHVFAGVCYEPLRRLWPLLGDRYALALLHDDVWADELDVWNAADADRAVDTLAGVILGEAASFAESYGSLEQLLAEFGHGEEHSGVDQHAVALLAAAGRFDEARTGLGRYKAETGDRRRDRETLRFVHQIERYIDSGGDRSIVPRRPPPSRYEIDRMPSVSEMWRQRRAGLEQEPAATGGPGRDSPPPDLTPPAWLDPPDRAVYPVAKNPQARWTEVQLDEHAEPYIERAYGAIPRLFGAIALATAWLSWEEGPHERLVVSLGDQRVGTVTPAASAAYRLVMDRATERDELPYVPARLTPRSELHLLEVQLPETRPRGESDV
jgi:hypothetical protein